MEKIFGEIKQERERQDEKWGEQNVACLDVVLLNRNGSCTPERMCAEYEIPSEARAKQLCDISFDTGRGTYAHIAVEEMSEVISAFDIHKRREELIQLTAVCVAWIQKIDRDILRQKEVEKATEKLCKTLKWKLLTTEQKERYDLELASDNWKKYSRQDRQFIWTFRNNK